MTEQKKVELPAQPEEPNQLLIVAEKLFNQTPHMVQDYKTLVNRTGGLLSSSMGYAYAKGLSDALKFILKETPKQEKK